MNDTRDNNQMDEPKENKCTIMFMCGFSEATESMTGIENKDCVYRRSTAPQYSCDYLSVTFHCRSAVAQVNKMVLMLQEAGIKLKDK